MPEIRDDEVLIKTQAFAITAGTRAGLQGSASYAGAPAAGRVMNGTGIGEVVASNVHKIKVGDRVTAPTGWQQYAALNADQVTVIAADHDPIHYLGPMGVNGLTAYYLDCLMWASPNLERPLWSLLLQGRWAIWLDKWRRFRAVRW